MAPWDLIDSQSARIFKNLSKSSFDHESLHLPPRCIYNKTTHFIFYLFWGEGGSSAQTFMRELGKVKARSRQGQEASSTTVTASMNIR